MKETYVKPEIEVITFDVKDDIVTCSGQNNGGCNHGGHSGNNNPQIPNPPGPGWPWWPWHW